MREGEVGVSEREGRGERGGAAYSTCCCSSVEVWEGAGVDLRQRAGGEDAKEGREGFSRVDLRRSTLQTATAKGRRVAA